MQRLLQGRSGPVQMTREYDGMIGQMMEAVEFPENYKEPKLPPKDWATTGAKGRKPNIIKSLYLDPKLLEKNSWVLHEKYERMKREECRHELYNIKPKNNIPLFILLFIILFLILY